MERYAFSAFGVTSFLAPDYSPRSSSAAAWDFLFHGQFEDAETGWQNYGYRFYVSELGRWPNRDPIGERGGVNLYEFIENWPQNSTDHFGLSESDFECCTDDIIVEGRRYLERAWPGALDVAEREWAHEHSCANINNSALGHLGDIPRCWHCAEERRDDLPMVTRLLNFAESDHVIIRCIAVDQNGEVADQLILDGTGGQTDYDEFCRTWPTPDPSIPGPNPEHCRKCRSDFNPTWDVRGAQPHRLPGRPIGQHRQGSGRPVRLM